VCGGKCRFSCCICVCGDREVDFGNSIYRRVVTLECRLEVETATTTWIQMYCCKSRSSPVCRKTSSCKTASGETLQRVGSTVRRFVRSDGCFETIKLRFRCDSPSTIWFCMVVIHRCSKRLFLSACKCTISVSETSFSILERKIRCFERHLCSDNCFVF